MEAASDVHMLGSDQPSPPNNNVEEQTLTVDPSYMTVDVDTLARPGSSLFDQVDEPTLKQPYLMSPADEFVSASIESEYVNSDRNDSDEEERVPYETFELAIPERKTFTEVVIPLPKYNALPYSTNQSGIVYDARMRWHTEIIEGNDLDFHPEDPRRILEIYNELKDAGLVVDSRRDPIPEDAFKLWHIRAREATADEVRLAHTREQYEWVESLPEKSNDALVRLGEEMDSVYLHKMTFMCAKLSAGGAIEACRAVVAGDVKNSIAVVRPPGHHAESYRPGGFCFFNNVCVAARVCQRDFPEKCRKILILDWDVHHGNGVQEIFYNDPNVLYISLHVHRDGHFYPSTQYGNEKHCGEGEGLGYNVNIPWPCHGMKDGDYMFAFQRVVIPIAQEFDPDLVIVAAGFDAAEGDDLGRCHVSPAGYAHMTHMLMSLAKGKIAVVLEGGYNLRSIAKSALAVTRTLMGEPPERMMDTTPTTPGIDTVHMVIRQQSKFWKRLYPPDSGTLLKSRMPGVVTASERMHDAVRSWQAKMLWEDFKMRPLPIMRDDISKSFHNQVLGTPNYEQQVPLLVVFHDPPEVVGMPNARTNKLELHNTWLADVSKSYIAWAIEHGFAVIDVNVPKFYTPEDDDGGYSNGESSETRARLTQELAHYLWDNYIEPNDAHDLFILGIGDAYTGLINLMNTNERCTNYIDHVFSFIAENVLQSVRRQTDDSVSDWYYKHSLVFVADDHGAWSPDRAKKLRKKYGNLVRSPHNNLNDMLAEHKDRVCNKMWELTQGWRDKQVAIKTPQLSFEGDASNNSNGTRIRPTPRLEEDVQGARVAMRSVGSPNSPRSAGLRSPVKMPPMGIFEVSSPARGSPRR